MKAIVTIIDDNGNPRGAWELKPSKTYEGDISTKYVFEFEYNQMNYDKYKAKLEEDGKMKCYGCKYKYDIKSAFPCRVCSEQYASKFESEEV